MNDTKPPRTQRGKTIFMVRGAPEEHKVLISIGYPSNIRY